MSEPAEVLERCGLSTLAARAYLAALEASPARVEDIVRISKIPRTRLYPALRELLAKGWLSADEGRPRRYVAADPSERLDRARSALDDALEGARPRLAALYGARTERFAGSLWVFAGDPAIGEKALDMVGHARRSILLVASFPMPGDGGVLPRAVRAAMSRGVSCRLVVPSMSDDWAMPLVKAVGGARAKRMPLRLLLVDDEQTLLTFPAGKRGAARALWNPSRELAGLFGGPALVLWEEASPG